MDLSKKFIIRRDIGICLLLVLLTFAVYVQVIGFEFVTYDDVLYVTEKPRVQAGLSFDNIVWAFTTLDAINWHPLTWLSHMLDCHLFGMNAGMHHLTSVLFHLANTVLLFLILNRMTGEVYKSGFVAALFALHPLHVQSVAWVAERKDVLSTFFWLLTTAAYIRYSKQPNLARYALVLICFVLGLMSKPMLVTLPFTLLLLDYWPLRRIRFQSLSDANGEKGAESILKLIGEKIPLLALAIGVSAITIVAQHAGGAVKSVGSFPLHIRMGNAVVSYIAYLIKTVWPTKLAVFYPHPGMPSWTYLALAAITLISVTAFFILRMKREPFLLVGWLWYLGTLVPVIGLVQVGKQAFADRYTYVPLIGVFVAIAWGVPLLAKKLHLKASLLKIPAMAIIVIMASLTFLQTSHWVNSKTLYRHDLAVTSGNFVIHFNMGGVFIKEGKTRRAIMHLFEAIRIMPDFYEAHYNLGILFGKEGWNAEANKHFKEALRLKPDSADAHNNYGLLLAKQGKNAEAIKHYRTALKYNPDHKSARKNLNALLVKQPEEP